MPETRSADHWDARYRSGELPWDTRRAEPRLTEVVAELDPPTRAAVDLGCGTGDNAMWLADQGYEALGVDIAPTAVAQAERRAKQAGLANVRFETASVLEGLPIASGSVGLAIDRGCLHTIAEADRARYVERLAGALAGGGLWLALCGSADEARAEGEEGPPRLSAAELVDAVESRFEVVKLERSSFTGADGRATHIAWRGLFRRR